MQSIESSIFSKRKIQMQKIFIAGVVLVGLCTTAGATTFDCGQIKDKKVRAACTAEIPPKNGKAKKATLSRTDLITMFAKQAREKISEELKDPNSAQFSKMQYLENPAYKSRVLCGYVNAKNSYGGYIGATFFFAAALKEPDDVTSLTKWITYIMPTALPGAASENLEDINEQVKMATMAQQYCNDKTVESFPVSE